MLTPASSKNQGELNPDANLDIMADFFGEYARRNSDGGQSRQKAAGTSEYCGLCGKSVHGGTEPSRVTGKPSVRASQHGNFRVADDPVENLSQN